MPSCAFEFDVLRSLLICSVNVIASGLKSWEIVSLNRCRSSLRNGLAKYCWGRIVGLLVFR